MKPEHNINFWLIPNAKQDKLVIKPDETASFDFDVNVDGTFQFNVWILCDTSIENLIELTINSETVYHSKRIMKLNNNVNWSRGGSVRVAKGEHKIFFRNVGKQDIVFDGLILTLDGGYILKGYADEHRQKILAGGDPLEIIENSEYYELLCKREDDLKNSLGTLYKMGFLERYDQKLSEEKCRNGVPMGGIGAGKVELDKDGIFTAITINNNCEVPIFKTESSFFAVYCDDGEKKCAKLLRKANYDSFELPLIDDIKFDGLFPTAKLEYQDKQLPVKLSLNAFSSLIPNDILNSSLPGITYKFTVENTGSKAVDTAILFSWENLINVGGSMGITNQNPEKPSLQIKNTWNIGNVWSDRTGNYQTPFDSEKSFGLRYFGSDDKKNPSSFGEYTISCRKDDVDEVCGVYKSWNVYTDSKALWDDFTADGCVNSDTELIADEEDKHTAGAISKKISLQPGEKKEIVFVLSWYMPVNLDTDYQDIGVYYSSFFDNSKHVNDYILEHSDEFYEKTTELHKQIFASSLPEWLKAKLINDMFPIYTCSWFTKDAKFSITEAPSGMMGCLGTLDQRLACNVIYTNLFRELDKTELTLFSRIQGSDGSISHELGWGKFDKTERKGTWSDLCSSFILQVYKHYLYTNDKEFLDDMYPVVKKAVQYQINSDRDKNTIPDVGAGFGTTYDTYRWYGTSAFVASLWLCELRICAKLAKIYNDDAFEQKCNDLFGKSQKAMIDELWNNKYSYGGYFNNYNDLVNNRHSENCFIAQLAGQWFAHLMDLGYILPEDKVKEALKTIQKRNVDLKDMCLFNDETTPDGDFDWYGYTFLQYDEVYYGCLAIYNDRVKEGIEVFKKIYDTTADAPWITPLTAYTDGTFNGLPYYMTNPASSFVLEALSGYMPDVVNQTIKLAPHTDGNAISMPLFSPSLWLWFDYYKKDGSINYKFKATKLISNAVTFKNFVTEVNGNVTKVLVNGSKVDFEQNGKRITFSYDFDMEIEKTYHVELKF